MKFYILPHDEIGLAMAKAIKELDSRVIIVEETINDLKRSKEILIESTQDDYYLSIRKNIFSNDKVELVDSGFLISHELTEDMAKALNLDIKNLACDEEQSLATKRKVVKSWFSEIKTKEFKDETNHSILCISENADINILADGLIRNIRYAHSLGRKEEVAKEEEVIAIDKDFLDRLETPAPAEVIVEPKPIVSRKKQRNKRK